MRAEIMIYKEEGFTLVEVMIAAGIFLVIVVSILGLAQIEGNAITSLWRSSYNDVALLNAKQMLDEMRCDKIPLIQSELILLVGREKIVVEVDKKFDERETGRLMWQIMINVKGAGRNNTMEVRKYCP
jgi:type II secretory pathway pseudopilin PulG